MAAPAQKSPTGPTATVGSPTPMHPPPLWGEIAIAVDDAAADDRERAVAVSHDADECSSPQMPAVVVANASSLSEGETADEGGSDDGDGDDDDDDNRERGKNRDNAGEKRSIDRRPLPRENLALATNAFRDPFPALTPTSATISRSSVLMDRQRATRSGSDSSASLTPPPSHAFHATTTPQTPPVSRSRTPPQRRPCSTTAGQTTPIRTSSARGCVGGDSFWIDPFPTPDVSVCGGSGGGSGRHGTLEDGTDDWEDSLRSIPNIPTIEEFHAAAEEERKENIWDIGGSVCIVNKSCPRLQSMGVMELPVRKVTSEVNLTMMKHPTLEDIWGALQSGPDGNDLVADHDLTTEGGERPEMRDSKKAMIQRDSSEHLLNEGKKRKERRESLKAIVRRESLEHLDDERDGRSLPRRRSKRETYDRSPTAPLETISFAGLQSPLISKRRDRSESIEGNSHTITNVTGADLANEIKALLHKRDGGDPPGGPLTPIRLSFPAWNAIKTSRAIVGAKTAGEIVFSPVRTAGNVSKKLVRSTRQKLKERKELRRKRRLERMKEPPRSWWIVIPADNPYKIAWDVLTMIWALLGAYRTHVRIRDRVFVQSPLIILTEIWFTIDILLNFVTEHKTRKGEVIRDGKAVWARYLTTWFVIDILSLIPWERIYVAPVVEKIKKRNFFQKTFFRSKAVVRVSRVLRGRHIKLFGRVSKQTGTPLRRLVSLLIKYVPKYLVFMRNMKGALVVRALRFVHWIHNMYKKIWVKAKIARSSYLRRRAARRASRLSLGVGNFGSPNSNGDDSDSDSDDDSEHGDDEDDDDGLEGDDESEHSGPVTTFHRAHSEGSPMSTLRRRAFSQNEVYASPLR